MPANTERRTKFVKLAEGRVQAALSAIRKIGNLSNRRSYDWDDVDVKKISKALREAIGDMERRFDGGPEQTKFKL
jgi:ribosome recycling factor